MEESKKLTETMSHAEYMRMKAEETRRRKGVKQRNKITDAQIAEIVVLRRQGVSYAALMKKYPIGYARLKKKCDEVGCRNANEIGNRPEKVVDEKSAQTDPTITPVIVSP
jgi:hypothetical protein